MAAAVTCGRSIVRDLYEPHEGARVMSRALTGLGVIAVARRCRRLASSRRFGWHAALLAARACSAPSRWRSSPGASTRRCRGATRDATRPAPLLRNWARGRRATRPSAPGPRCSALHLRRPVLHAGRLVVRLHRRARRLAARPTALILGSISLAYIGGTVLCRRLLLRHGLRGAVRARRVVLARRRRSAWRRSAWPACTRCGRSLAAAVPVSRSATASTSPAARPARSGRSRRRRAPRRRCRAS